MEDDFVIPDNEGNSPSKLDIASELEAFRRQWYSEIHAHAAEQTDNFSAVNQCDRAVSEPSDEDEARYLFLQGVAAERSGRLYNAIQYYRKAVQLVPDIEFKIDEYKPKRRERVRDESESSAGLSDASDVEDEITDLVRHIHNMHYTTNENAGRICIPAAEPKCTHIGDLPVELMQYILKWVVSSDLDIYSLEQLACVSRGFYLCARDEELWRLVCLRIWGINCGSAMKYGSFRNMYIQRPHLRFNGCYISKCFYYRSGEKSLDNYYQPYHRVEYYRYIRFFPEGKVLMLTSPENPYVVLPMLLSRSSSPQGLLSGYYKLTGDRVTMVLKKVRSATEYLQTYRYRRLKNAHSGVEGGEQSFDAEFTVKTVGDRPHWQLSWAQYAIHTINRLTREDTVAEFELSNKNYPPLLFSRVRSFTAYSRSPLR